MKILFSIALLFCFQQFSYSQNDIQANLYYQFILNEQKNIGKEILEFRKSASELNLKILKFQINKSIEVVKNKEAYKNENELKDAAINLFTFFNSVCENQYVKMLKLVEDPDLEYKDFTL